MPDQIKEDHDALILLKARVTALEERFLAVCKKIDSLTIVIREGNDRLLREIGDKFDTSNHDCKSCKDDLNNKVSQIGENRVPWSSFKWIFGGTMGVVIGAVIFIGGMSWDTRKYLERHIIFSEMVYYQVTGERWDAAARESLLKAKEHWEKYKEKGEKYDIPVMP